MQRVILNSPSDNEQIKLLVKLEEKYKQAQYKSKLTTGKICISVKGLLF